MKLFNKIIQVIIIIYLFGGTMFVPGLKSQNFDPSPYLSIKNVIVDGDTLSSISQRFMLPWYAKKLRIEFEVLPEDSPDYKIEYLVNRMTRYNGVTENRYLEFLNLIPGESLNIELFLSSTAEITGMRSNMKVSFRIQHRPPPGLKIRDIIIDNKSQGPGTNLELDQRKHLMQFIFAIEPPDYPGWMLHYDFRGPDYQFLDRTIADSILTFEVSTSGEYALFVRLTGDFTHNIGLQINFRIRETFFKEHHQLVMFLGILCYFLINIIFAYMIVKDANKTNREARYWVIFTLFTSIFGYLVYKIYSSSSMINCFECDELVSPKYKFCPFCQTQLKDSCPQCGADVQSWMHYCIACSTELKSAKTQAVE